MFVKTATINDAIVDVTASNTCECLLQGYKNMIDLDYERSYYISDHKSKQVLSELSGAEIVCDRTLAL